MRLRGEWGVICDVLIHSGAEMNTNFSGGEVFLIVMIVL